MLWGYFMVDLTSQVWLSQSHVCALPLDIVHSFVLHYQSKRLEHYGGVWGEISVKSMLCNLLNWSVG